MNQVSHYKYDERRLYEVFFTIKIINIGIYEGYLLRNLNTNYYHNLIPNDEGKTCEKLNKMTKVHKIYGYVYMYICM